MLNTVILVRSILNTQKSLPYSLLPIYEVKLELRKSLSEFLQGHIILFTAVLYIKEKNRNVYGVIGDALFTLPPFRYMCYLHHFVYFRVLPHLRVRNSFTSYNVNRGFGPLLFPSVDLVLVKFC
jgi:hypothetical protein